MNCPVCQHSAAQTVPSRSAGDNTRYNCTNCGDFSISEQAVINLRNFPGDRWKASSWIRQNQTAVITKAVVDDWEKLVSPSLETRAIKALRWLSQRFPMGMSFNLATFVILNQSTKELEANNAFQSISWSRNVEDAGFLIMDVMVKELGWLTCIGGETYKVSPRGWLQLEGIGKTDSQIGFCAMWFNDQVKVLWTDCIEPAIRDAGYEPLRIDGKEHNNKIDDEIIASIRQSKFVIADLTGNRGGVYYEAGFAHGLSLPVIFMCRESSDDKPHFDIRQYNTIFWAPDNLASKREDLKNRIIATMGKGSYKPL